MARPRDSFWTMMMSGDEVSRRRRRADGHSVGVGEPERAVVEALHTEPALVHQSMVSRAEQHEVVERGLAALGPVLDVMAMQPLGGGAAGEAAPLVAARERTAYGWGDAAGSAPHTERLAVGAVHHGDDSRIAAKPPGGLRRDGGAVLDFTASRASVREYIGLDVDHDFVAVGCKHRGIARFEHPLGPSTPAHRRGAPCATALG